MAVQISLARQVDRVLKEVRDELARVSSGIVFIHIRNNTIGKFGVRHDALVARESGIEAATSGLSEEQQMAFRSLALESLKYKTNWTHGEIQFEFAIIKNILVTNVHFESNYNMAKLNQPFN